VPRASISRASRPGPAVAAECRTATAEGRAVAAGAGQGCSPRPRGGPSRPRGGPPRPRAGLPRPGAGQACSPRPRGGPPRPGGWASAAGGRAGVFAAANADWRYRCCAALTFAEVNRIRARQQQAAVTFITANALGRWRLRARSATTRRSPARTARPGVRQRERRRHGRGRVFASANGGGTGAAGCSPARTAAARARPGVRQRERRRHGRGRVFASANGGDPVFAKTNGERSRGPQRARARPRAPPHAADHRIPRSVACRSRPATPRRISEAMSARSSTIGARLRPGTAASTRERPVREIPAPAYPGQSGARILLVPRSCYRSWNSVGGRAHARAVSRVVPAVQATHSHESPRRRADGGRVRPDDDAMPLDRVVDREPTGQTSASVPGLLRQQRGQRSGAYNHERARCPCPVSPGPEYGDARTLTSIHRGRPYEQRSAG